MFEVQWTDFWWCFSICLRHKSSNKCQGYSGKETDACMCMTCIVHLVAFIRMTSGSLGSRNLGNWFTERENDKTQSPLFFILFYFRTHGDNPGKTKTKWGWQAASSHCSQPYQMFVKSWQRKVGQADRSVSRTIPASELILFQIFGSSSPFHFIQFRSPKMCLMISVNANDWNHQKTTEAWGNNDARYFTHIIMKEIFLVQDTVQIYKCLSLFPGRPFEFDS